MWTRYALVFIALVGAVSCYSEGRVVNGTDATIQKYPFAVSIRSTPGYHFCGASIIAPRWVLTAGHCVEGYRPQYINLQFASTELDANTPNKAEVKRIIMHEGYDPYDNYANDIALLELKGTFAFNGRTLAPVTLPEPNFEIPQTLEGTPGVLVGWGSTEFGGPNHSLLQEVELKIYSDAECIERHNGSTTPNHICGGIDEGGKGQCNGDSGGPLLYQGHIQLGVVSWSRKPCTIPPYPGVYTKVSHYIGWIQKNMNS